MNFEKLCVVLLCTGSILGLLSSCGGSDDAGRRELAALLTDEHVGNVYVGTILCSGNSGSDIVVGEISVHGELVSGLTTSATAKIGFGFGASSSECTATVSVDLHRVTFSLTDRVAAISTLYDECVLPNAAGQSGGILKTDITVVDLTGSGDSKKAGLHIAIRTCER